jgi:acetylornithine deacetylase/succinyl-diaminopimelate desuccinylase-like protein
VPAGAVQGTAGQSSREVPGALRDRPHAGHGQPLDDAIIRPMATAPLRSRVSVLALCGLAAAGAHLAAQPSPVSAWRAQHERQIVGELLQLLAIPNVSSVDDMQKNADALSRMFRQRGFGVELFGEKTPVVYARMDVPQARGTIVFYIHYDGQPVNPVEWTHCPPFEPCIVGPAGVVSVGASAATFDPDWRIYGRSAADDKAPIVALLAAIDALRATGTAPLWNVRVVLDGQEEAGSENFERFAATEGPELLKGDVAVFLDGPRHPSNRPTAYFGVRGGTGFTLTVYGASADLHSGNYGNWAPDPSMRLAQLLASMKDEDGRVTIRGFYDDVVPLTATEIEALDAAPNVEASLRKNFLVAQPERAGERLERKLNTPTLSILQMEAGGGMSAPPRTAIPAFAIARMEIRLVNGTRGDRQVDLVVDHVRQRGYHVVIDRAPTDEERFTHPRLARVDWRRGGFVPARTSLDDPFARAVVAAIAKAGTTPVLLPTLGGSLPYSVFSEDLKTPTVGLAIANFDNNQHGPDENLRLGHLWEGIDMLAAVLTMAR